jgi:CRISPR-associated protein Csm5
MAEILRTTPLTLECLSPVHIGSGDRLGPLDFVREGGRVLVIDQDKFLAYLGKTPTLSDAYLPFCESERPILADFLRAHRIPAGDFAAYALRAAGSVGRDVLTFIKAPNGAVFIPGSSVKGAIRSALLHRIVSEQAGIREAIVREASEEVRTLRRPVGGRRAAKLRRASGTADRAAFGRDHNRDVMRMFQLADSRPVAPSDLVLAEVRVLTVRSGALAIKETPPGNPMRLTVEVLPTGTRLESRMTWNAYLGASTGPATRLDFGDRVPFVSAWLTHCNAVARDALQREVEFCRQFKEPALVLWHEGILKRLESFGANQCLLHLGWGAGFDAMAVTNLFPPEATRRIRQGANLGKIGPDGPVEPFPKSRKVVWHDEKKLDPLGWILLTVGEKPTEATRRVIAVPSGERTPVVEPRPQPQPRPGPRRPPEPPVHLRLSTKADLEALRRSLQESKEGGRGSERTTKASEKAKREQDKIWRRYRGENEK